MKTRIWLALSVCLNGLFIFPHLLPDGTVRPISTTRAVRSAGPVQQSRSLTILSSVHSGVFSNTIPLHWSQIESADYRQYIAYLRAIGCPEETVRDIIIADVNKLYAPKIAASYASRPKFWESNVSAGSKAMATRLAEAKELEREKRELLKELLGIDVREEMYRTTGLFDQLRASLQFLPEAKRPAARSILEKYEELERQVYYRAGGVITPEDHEELRNLNRERRSELAGIFSASELEEYEMRESFTADRLRARLIGFEPNEEEFRMLFRLQKRFDDEFTPDPHFSSSAPDFHRRMSKANVELQNQIRAALGEQRYADYQRAQDQAYRGLVEIAQRYDIPKETVLNVYEIKRIAEEQAQRLRQDESLAPEQVRALIRATARETERSVQSFLGDKAFQAYAQRGGYWISRIGR